MAFIVKTGKAIRNNWKKSTFAAIALSYGYSRAKQHFETQELMRVYCERAAAYGKKPCPVQVNPRRVTVILNPSANKRKCAEDFEEFCAPLLHLSGILVDVVKTEAETQARDLMEKLENTDAVVVAGGDGTLSEVVTGLLRRTNENTNGLIPIGVLPLGRTNVVAKNLFPGGDHLEKVRSLADATMAVIEEAIKPIDVMRIEVLETENKPVYAVGGLKWGAYRDAEVKTDSYWYFGGLRNYATYLFNGYKNSLTWSCKALLNYSPPCEGCSNCVNLSSIPVQSKRWYQQFVKDESEKTKQSRIKNSECEEEHEKNITTTDFQLFTSNAIPAAERHQQSKLKLLIGPKKVDYLEFVTQGWDSVNGQNRQIEEVIEARTVAIKPDSKSYEGQEFCYSIDNENFEVKPIKITLLPKLINVFCKQENNL